MSFSPIGCNYYWFFLVLNLSNLTSYYQGGLSLLYIARFYSPIMLYINPGLNQLFT